MKISEILKEALASAWASKVPSLLVAVVSAAMCFVALMTVGQSAASQAAVQASLAGAGGRMLVVRDTTGAGFVNQRTLSTVNALSSVVTAVGVGFAFDSNNGAIGAGGTLVTTWPVLGDLPSVLTLLEGRWPLPGEALVTVSAQMSLGLVAPAGFLAHGDDTYPIVGLCAPRDGFTDFSSGAVVNANQVLPAVELMAVIDSINDAPATQTAVLGILASTDPTGMSIQSPRGLSELSQQVGNQLAGFGRSLLLLILGVGGLFVAAVVLADVLVRRRDLGRRRTLGITRIDLMMLVTLRATVSALIGAAVGTTAAVVVTGHFGYAPSATFAISVAVLATLTAAIAALAPVGYAANIDPVRVMRTP